MAADLMFASWATILHRSWLIASGGCSDAEYRRMVHEKADAAFRSGLALVTGRDAEKMALAVLAPWHRRAAANSRRLRKLRK